jgi:hypothetical protein
MKKKLIIGLFIILWVTLWWCSKKIEQTIVFENYKIPLETIYQYQETNDNTALNSIIKQYIQKVDTWFISSIIIAKNTIKSWVNINNYWAINEKSLTKKINWSELDRVKEIEFECASWSIVAILQNFIIEQDWTKQYLNQLFFTYWWYIYGISTITEDKTESKKLSNSIKNIECLLQK